MNEWVDVKERLPDKGFRNQSGSVLVTTVEGWMYIAHWNFERGCWDDGDWKDNIEGITHWMPLPNAPKES